MRDLINLFDHFDFSPVNTALLAILALFIRTAVNNILSRLNSVEEGLIKVNRRNRRQDFALKRLEQHQDLAPIAYEDDED